MKKISLPTYIALLLIVLLVCGLLIFLIVTNKNENKGLNEEPTIEETYKQEDIYIEFGYQRPVIETSYPPPEPKQWKYIITKDGNLFYYSNFERENTNYQSIAGETFIKKLNDKTINEIEEYINEKMSEAVERPEGNFYIILNNSEDRTWFKDLNELETIINK